MWPLLCVCLEFLLCWQRAVLWGSTPHWASGQRRMATCITEISTGTFCGKSPNWDVTQRCRNGPLGGQSPFLSFSFLFLQALIVAFISFSLVPKHGKPAFKSNLNAKPWTEIEIESKTPISGPPWTSFWHFFLNATFLYIFPSLNSQRPKMFCPLLFPNHCALNSQTYTRVASVTVPRDVKR